MKLISYKSDGLGGFFGVTHSIKLGTRKHLSYYKTNILLFFILLSGITQPDSSITTQVSLILALQRSDEAYKNIKPHTFRKFTITSSILRTSDILICLFVAKLLSWVYYLLLLSGDVEENPGPNPVDYLNDSSGASSTILSESLSCHLSIFHMNIQSIVPKIDLIRGEAEAYDVLIFSESWLKPTVLNDTICIENYLGPFRTDRPDRPGGGVVAYVRETIPCKRRPDLEIQGLEALWFEIAIKSKKILIGGFYRPPNSNTGYMDLIKESIDRAYNTNIVDIIITGDFNFNMMSNNLNKLKELILEYNLNQLITDPTHFTETSSSLIDLILVRNQANILCSMVADPFVPNQVRYHCPVVVFLKFTRPKIKNFKRRIWIHKLADYDKYRRLLSESELVTQLEQDSDISSNVKLINQTILKAAEISIPNKVVTIKPNDHPWITCHIKRLIRKRKRLHRRYNRTPNNHLWENYKLIRNQITTEIRKSKTEYFEKVDKLLSSNNCNTKTFWKLSKQVLNLKPSSTIPTLVTNNNYAETDFHKANMLNEYFASQTVVNDSNKQLPPLAPAQHILNSISVTEQDVNDVLINLDATKASGPDQISPRLLREGAPILSKPFSLIFNRSLQQGYFPREWKDANITPIHKKDEKSLPGNYRPISLLSQLGKTMERCVHKHLYNYVISHQILTPLQSGFVRGDSTTYQLIHTYHQFCQAVDSGKEVRAVFCDVSKAFDRVWHRGLLHKLAGIGCSEFIIKWFSSYLSDRRQRVMLNGQTSDWASVLAGVPQGSILGPLLFLIYINDLVSNIGCSIRLFADDTSLYIVVECPNTAANLLNSDLQTINKWADDWLVIFNAIKTLSMVISRKLIRTLHPPLFMNNIQLRETEKHKHLGLTFMNDCDWSIHVANIAAKASTRLNLMRSLKF